MAILSHFNVNKLEVVTMDSTWSARLPDEMKEKLQSFLEQSGISSKDFISSAIQALELDMASDSNKLFQADIEELRLLTGRINNIFVNMLEKELTFQKDKETEYDVRLEKKNEMISQSSIKIKELEERINTISIESSELRKVNEELIGHNNELTEMVGTGKALIAEYKEKNETLTGLLGKFESYEKMVDELKTALDSEKNQRVNSEIKLKEALKDAEAMRVQKVELQHRHEQELSREHELMLIDKEKELLKVRNEFQGKIELAQEEYSSKVKELLKTIQDLQHAHSISKVAQKKKLDSKAGKEDLTERRTV